MSTKKNITWLLIPIITLIATISHTPKIISALAPDNFSDVSSGNSHFVAIDYLRANNIIQGYEDGTFKSKQKISRAEALKIFLLASGATTETDIAQRQETLTQTNESPLQDVSATSWFAPYVSIAKEKNIISGYEDGTFQPEKTINLAESLKIFLNCYPELEYPPTDDIFADATSTDWFAKYAAYAKQKNLVNITLENKIDPNQDMTRGYMAEIIYRKIMNDTVDLVEFGKATYYGNGADGANTASGEKLDNTSFVAAHKTLPFGTIVEVTNLATGKSIQVKIIDRGPYGHGRIIDLSMGAFESLADLSVGVINVQDKVIHLP
ncbi:septal ring lytic transglycosylase RlpA family protein [Candidatus Gracilibacteria bacterium]|jgi:rare lipoprotein A|nr:septal ring lytic transglycosylase RlpA family protein [Candidatus Gracilibacteria bacterium]